MGLGVWGTIVGKGVGSAYAVAGVVCFLLLLLCVCEGCLCFFMGEVGRKKGVGHIAL